ncbi:bone marrow proteoglycan-like [Trichosurus vulpecula]|uniref:bone marrow proteoglycan-like n=1 Tax=Trichosurus vulpecula TaxID=9337 RepID=UPI00186B525E|nr:bone marrow proteoglycan-like [Trichosurus vulpecula]
MKLSLILSLLLLGTVSSLQLKNEALELEASEGEKALVQELEIPEKGDNLTTGNEEEDDEGNEEEDDEDNEVEASEHDDKHCPKEEDVVHVLGTPECKTCRFLIVNKLRRFNRARKICKRCYHGHLVSIHSSHTNNRIRCLASKLNQSQIWIGARVRGRSCRKRFWWVDGSHWTFSYWAAGQPGNGGGRCVAFCTRGGHWRRAPCKRRLPFACSY